MVRNFDWKVTVICTISLAMVIVFADQVCATLIRPLVERMRPSNPNNPLSEKVHIVNNHRAAAMDFRRVTRPILSHWRFCEYALPPALAHDFFHGLGIAYMLFAHLSRSTLSRRLACRLCRGLCWSLFYLPHIPKISGITYPKRFDGYLTPPFLGLATIAGIFVYAGVMCLTAPQ